MCCGCGTHSERLARHNAERGGGSERSTEELYPLYDDIYRYANGVPLVEGEGALSVNWCEVTITGTHRKTPYHCAWITDWKITDENVVGIAATGRCRWKIENENNNTLKTKGYHLEHNFGHGRKHLSSLLATMNMLALLTHTFPSSLHSPWTHAPCTSGAIWGAGTAGASKRAFWSKSIKATYTNMASRMNGMS